MGRPTFFITDVFTNKKYGGNPLATFVDCDALSDEEMQQIAKEINFSETTFITSCEPVDGGFDVRIFTPNAEVEFAGHPTLGTAYVIREKLGLTQDREVILNLKAGKIPVSFTDASSPVWMKQIAPKFGNRYDENRLAHVLGLSATDILFDIPIEEVSTGFPTLIVPLTGLSALKRVRINREEYFALFSDAWAKVILVFCCEGHDTNQQISVRVFADYFGISEDAATGSSNGALAAYLVQHQVLGGATIDIAVGQGYEMGRPSTLTLTAGEVDGVIDVSVGGHVVAVAEGVWGK